jgi:hypothetical protein
MIEEVKYVDSLEPAMKAISERYDGPIMRLVEEQPVDGVEFVGTLVNFLDDNGDKNYSCRSRITSCAMIITEEEAMATASGKYDEAYKICVGIVKKTMNTILKGGPVSVPIKCVCLCHWIHHSRCSTYDMNYFVVQVVINRSIIENT